MIEKEGPRAKRKKDKRERGVFLGSGREGGREG
jgi:hypothetical protein